MGAADEAAQPTGRHLSPPSNPPARTGGAFSHTVKLMAAQLAIPYRKRGKNDAEAIGETVGQSIMHFVAVKTEQQQAVLMVRRARSLEMANRTARVNQSRGLLGEFGMIVPQGVTCLRRHLPQFLEDAENGLRTQGTGPVARTVSRTREASRRRRLVESIGPMTATGVVASMGNPNVFKSGRNYAASLGLAPRQHSSGGNTSLGPLTLRLLTRIILPVDGAIS